MNQSIVSPLQIIAELDDQWVIFSDQSAFIGEAYARLLADHPNLPKEVIQGGEYTIRQLRQQSQHIGTQLIQARQLLQDVTPTPTKPTGQDQ
jgi:hypothetical protein